MRPRQDELAALFAPRVVLDYGVPELLAPEEIAARWRPLFAGFDRTRPMLSDATLRGAMPSPPSELWTEGNQFHFYDDPPTIERATAEAVAHLRRTLL